MSSRQGPPALEAAEDHEVLRVFAEQGFALNRVLGEMFNDHHSHCTERRGCGFSQVTRYLGDFVNTPRDPGGFDEIRLFESRDIDRLRALVDGAQELGVALSWRNLDQRDAPPEVDASPDLRDLYSDAAKWQGRLRGLHAQLEREESRLAAGLIADLVLPVEAEPAGTLRVKGLPERPEVGTCPMAEKFFLELAEGFVRRKGRMNVIVGGDSRPVFVEKMGIGDDHSCVSLVPLLLNGVRLPAGSLFAAAYGEGAARGPGRAVAGDVIPIERCDGFRFLRLTTLAVSPGNRARAFTAQFRAQREAGFFSPDSTTLAGLQRRALDQVGSADGT